MDIHLKIRGIYATALTRFFLEIDLVRWPDGKTQIIDQESLERHLEGGYLSEALKEGAEKTPNEVKAAAKEGLCRR